MFNYCFAFIGNGDSRQSFSSHFILLLAKRYTRSGSSKKVVWCLWWKTLTERQCQNWFVRFRFGDFFLKDASRSRRPTEIDDDKIKAMIENNQRRMTREITEKLNISHTCVERHLKQLGYVNKLDIWVPHKLNKIQLTKLISIGDPMPKCNETDLYLKRIIRVDEKLVVYDNVVRKRSWSKRDELAQSTSKADIHQKKVMLSVWWDFKGIVYLELLPRNQTINSNVYYRQLMKLDKATRTGNS